MRENLHCDRFSRASHGRKSCIALSVAAFSWAMALAGCHKEVDPQVLGNADPLVAQLDAARRIESPVDRDEAMKSVAISAATEARGVEATQAIDAIKDDNVRDSAAAESAIRLARAGQLGTANTIAAKVKDAPLRDATYKKIAVPRKSVN